MTDAREAFRHHSWATEQLLDAARPLTDEQLMRPCPGIYGSTLDTLRHIVDADTGTCS